MVRFFSPTFSRRLFRLLPFPLLLLQATRLPAESSGDAGATVDGIAAYVNGDAITISDVLGGVRVFIQDAEWLAGRTREEAFRAAYTEALDQLIHQRLILQDYRAGDARLPSWLIEKRMAEILDNRFEGDRASLLRELGNERMTLADWKTRIEEQMIAAAMRHSQVEAHVRITPSQIRDHYIGNLSRYTHPAGIHLGLIRIRPAAGESDEETERRATSVLERLARGESFETLARIFSDDPSSARGGDWGWIVPEEILAEALAEALQALGPGETSGIVRTATAFFILHKKAERAAGTKPLEEVQDQIERKLYAAEAQRIFQVWMARLRANSSIRTFGEFGDPAGTP